MLVAAVVDVVGLLVVVVEVLVLVVVVVERAMCNFLKQVLPMIH